MRLFSDLLYSIMSTVQDISGALCQQLVREPWICKQKSFNYCTAADRYVLSRLEKNFAVETYYLGAAI